jgi:PAS domain S-box-containing protein
METARIDRSALDALSSSIAIVGEDGRILAVNKAWRDFAAENHPKPGTVCEGADYLGACDSARGSEASQAMEIAAALREMLGGGLDSFALEYSCHSPELRRWFRARASPFVEGGRIRVAIAHEPITERVLAEQALRERERRFRELFERSPVGISETSVDGRLVRANSAYARLYGYDSPEEMMGEVGNVVRLYGDPEDREEVLRILSERGTMEPREMRVLRRDGSPFFVLVSARVLHDEAGAPRGYQANHIDIGELKRAEAELLASREQMRALASRAQAASEEERTSMARKIHDLLSQTLTRLKIDLVWLQRRLESPDAALPAKALVPRVAEMIGMADEAVGTVQRIATELRPAVLDSLGLGAALAWLARDFREHGEIACRAFVPDGELPIDRDAATAAFRIAQESLTNVVRHSGARKAEIYLAEEDDRLVLSIQDDGIGVDPGKLSDPFSIGLAGMRERALLLGGSFDIRSSPGSGTTVEARFPLQRPDRQAKAGS